MITWPRTRSHHNSAVLLWPRELTHHEGGFT